MSYLSLALTQDVGFTPTHIDAWGQIGDPPILAATIVSAVLLMTATTLWLILWFRSSKHRVAMRGLLVLSGALLYLFAAAFQMWLGNIFYRYYVRLDSSVTLGLWVPFAPVWWSGATSAVAYLIIRGLRRARLRRT